MNLAKKFIDGVTAKQLENFIEAVFKTADKKTMNEILDQAKPELKSFVDNLLTEKPKENLSTDDKFIQTWESLKSEISDCIYELGDEEGEYAEQYDQWHPPYFDLYSFAEDLENIFEKMLPMIDKVYKIKTDDIDFFTELLSDISDGIDRYPEWMGEPCEDLAIEKNGLECILKSEFLKVNSISDFLDNVIRIWNHKYEFISLNSDSSISFITKQTETVKREFYNEFLKRKNDDNWKKHLNDPDSMWHKTFHKLTKKFDKKIYLINSEELIVKKWNYGIPVYKNFLKLKKYDSAENICSKIADNYISQLNRYDSDKYNFENYLFKSLYHDKNEQLLDFLNDWKDICEELKLENKKNAIAFQIQFYSDCSKWDKLKRLFKKIDEPYKNNYLNEWKEKNGYCYCWVEWLIEAECSDSSQQFLDKITDWLNEEINEKDLCFLTYHFDIDKKYTNLIKLIKNRTGNYNEKIKWLSKNDYLQLKPILLQFWKDNINKLIPSPESVYRYDYSEHAGKLAIARELNENIYIEFLDLWRVKYKNKRNLWKELEKYKINKTNNYNTIKKL
jgi:hypothetical protein